MREMKVGDRVQAVRGGTGTGTAIEFRAGKVLVSYYTSGEQVWFDRAEIVNASVSTKQPDRSGGVFERR